MSITEYKQSRNTIINPLKTLVNDQPRPQNTGFFKAKYQATSAAGETVFDTNQPCWVSIAGLGSPGLTGLGYINVFHKPGGASNVQANATFTANQYYEILSSPCYFPNGLNIVAYGDGTNNVTVFVEVFPTKPAEPVTNDATFVTYINSSVPTNNYDSSHNCAVAWDVIKKERILLSFRPSDFPTGLLISKAELVLKAFVTRSNIDIQIHRMLTAWTASMVTWNTKDGSTAWGTPGGQSGVDYAATPFFDGSISIVNDQELRLDITDEVQSFINREFVNYGWMMLCNTQQGNANELIFESGESGTQTPYIEITPS